MASMHNALEIHPNLKTAIDLRGGKIHLSKVFYFWSFDQKS
jgi:hypothetical protein